MSEVVMVHGAFHELWGPFRLWVRWTPSVLDGLWVAGVSMSDVSLPRLQDRSAVAFWGDLVRPRPRTAEQIAAHVGIHHVLREQLHGPGVGVLRRLLDQRIEVAGSRSARCAGAATHAFEHRIDPVGCLPRRSVVIDVRAAVHERLERHLTPDTKVVIAHSLGTVIAYQVLCARPDLAVDLITVGSPLGDPALVFPLLQPAPVDGRGVWPVGVRRWTNVAAEGDLATAGCPQLAAAFGPRVEDHLVYNGRHAHNAEPYLNSRAVGEALADALSLPRRS